MTSLGGAAFVPLSRSLSALRRAGRHEDRTVVALRAAVASHWSEQQQNCHFLPEALNAGQVNIRPPLAIRAGSERYAVDGSTS